MKKMNAQETMNVNGGEFLALCAIWGGIVCGWLWLMGKMGDYGINAVKRKR